MKKFTVGCLFGDREGSITLYIGQPESSHHPVHFQAEWLSKERGGVIPQQIMQNLATLQEIAARNNVPFDELCQYAMEAAQLERGEKNPQKTKGDVKSDVSQEG